MGTSYLTGLKGEVLRATVLLSSVLLLRSGFFEENSSNKSYVGTPGQGLLVACGASVCVWFVFSLVEL